MQEIHQLSTFVPGKPENSEWAAPIWRDVSLDKSDNMVHGGELFSRRPGLGIGLSDPKIDQRLGDLVLRDPTTPPRLYRTDWAMPELEETYRAMHNKGQGFVLMEGELGGGKSTTLYDLRRLLREKGEGYVFIDGHFEARPAKMEAALRWALENHYPALIDSLDYFFSKKLNRPKNGVATYIDWEAKLREFVQRGGTVVATTHTPPWLNKNLKDDEAKRRFNGLKEESNKVLIRGVIDPGNLEPLIDRLFRNSTVDRRKEAVEALMPLAQAGGLSFRRMKVLIKSRPDWLENLAHESLGEIMAAIDTKDRIKTRAPEEYVFL